MDSFQEQIDELRSRLCLEPFNAELHQQLGCVLYKSGDIEAAHAAHEQANILDPADPFAYLYLGNIYYTQCNYDDALEQFENARQRDPYLAMPHICIADTYSSLGKWALADEHYRTAVQLDPDCPIAQRNLASWNEFKETLDEEDYD
jgi:tetratricopeptide (TPR) repeat protein